MYSVDILDLTAQKLGNIKEQKATKYKESTKGFSDFIQAVTNQPPENQLQFILNNLDGLPSEINSLLFSIAAMGIRRAQDLPPNNPEKKSIEGIVANLGDLIINGLTKRLLPRWDILSSIQLHLGNWIENFQFQDSPDTSQETLLAAFCIISYFESVIPDSFKESKKDLTRLREQIANKFNQLVQEHSNLLRPYDASLRAPVVEQLSPVEVFRQNLANLARIERLRHLDRILSSQNPMNQFWNQYNTQTKFTQLMDDLRLQTEQRNQWQLFFDWHVSGNKMAKVKIEAPEILGGVPAKIFTLNKIKLLNLQAIANLGVERGNYNYDVDNLLINLERELVQVPQVEIRDIQTIKSQHSQTKSAKGISAVGLGDLFAEIKRFQQYLQSQSDQLVRLSTINNLIEQLNDEGVDTSSLDRSFEDMLEQTINSMPHENKVIPQTPREKIALMNQMVEEALDTSQKIHQDLENLTTKMYEAAPKSDVLITAASQFVTKHEKSFGHLLLCWFSSTYKEMFESIKTGAKNGDPVQIASVLVGQAEEFSKKYKIVTFFKSVQDLNKLSSAKESDEADRGMEPL
ncbi:Uncharacterised protein [Legionella wadsworthii]|uniref:Uncharacterized protein n=1 Tax=Legionella wadsworthii TaxID=28088 RepID=A0A378M045_9GAMM|nr:hypothetical protein [Legionella wadsworthii]STY29701.1 Uncharacterised protein [Legionella wadsworthii]